ncbi:AMP-binding protein [Streptomyces sp. PA03-6a]|nr:AMP-binding protein [Streptomyces sp. PA03-6a]
MANVTQVGPTLSGFTLDVLRWYPDRIAFAWEGGALTYAGASDLIGRMQSVFAAHGLRRGSCVALLSGNRAETWCALIAAQASGMAVTWVLYFSSLEDQEHQLRDAGADVLIVDVSRAERGGELAARTDQLSQVFTLGPLGFGVDLIAAAGKAGAVSPRSFAEPEDVAFISYTGGTTGYPKGAVRRHSPSSSHTFASILSDFEIPKNPRFLMIGPLSHVSGVKVLPTLMRGGSVHLLSDVTTDHILSVIERERINFTLMMPSMIYAMLNSLDNRKADLSCLELLLYGGASMAPERLREGMDRLGPVFAQLYGQTECYPISYLSRGDHDPNRPELLASCGRPAVSAAVTILDSDGVEIRDGEVGEICVRSPMVMDGYKNLPDLTAETFRNGWLHTGDVGRMDDGGYLYILDRLNDLIVMSSGPNVYPRGLEEVLVEHEAVSQAAVFGTSDEETGEAVNVVVVLRGDSKVSAEELQSYVRARKGHVQVPRYVHFVDEMPLTSLGKVDKNALRVRVAEQAV